MGMHLKKKRSSVGIVGLCLFVATAAVAQRAELRPSQTAIILPGTSDSNSPVHWKDGRFTVYQSFSLPLVSTGERQTQPLRARPVLLNSYANYPLWIESTWMDDDGTLYAWYHHESWVCNPLAEPSIGALISHDGGYSFQDLGIILKSGYPRDCGAQNGFFAGGHGDFTVLLDQGRNYFYFYFTNYSGPAESQGIAAARMAFSDRGRPIGRVWKFRQNSWAEPGLDGRVSAILPARVSWSRLETDSFWGPSLHWNTYLNQFVMLLNHACCAPGWPQEGIYVSFNPDLSNPTAWSEPAKILEGDQAGWYPQVIGLRSGTDKVAGRVARFYMAGESRYEIIFGF
jgi:hypothetical protein